MAANPLIGVASDLPVTTPGVFEATINVYPTETGFTNGPVFSVLSAGNYAIPDFGGAVLSKVDGTKRGYVGTAIKLWEFTTAGALTDRTRAVGGDYAATEIKTWSFTAFGDVVLAANKADAMQFGNAAAFAAVSGAPKAHIIVTCGPPASPFVMALNYDDGTNTPDGWYCSAISNYASWTPSIATQCVKSQLLEPVGPIVAAIPFRDGVVAFKKDAMYFGQYVGVPDVWAWTRITTDIGCVGKRAVVAAHDKIYFGAANGIYVFDGSYPRRLECNNHSAWASIATMAAAATGGPDRAYILYRKDDDVLFWGTAVASPNTVSLTAMSMRSGKVAQIGQLTSGTVKMLNAIDADYFLTSTFKVASATYGFSTSSGTSEAVPAIKTWLVGDDQAYSRIARWVFRWTKKPATSGTSGTMNAVGCIADLGTPETTVTMTFDANRVFFDGLAAGNWIQGVFYLNGGFKFDDLYPVMQPAGKK